MRKNILGFVILNAALFTACFSVSKPVPEPGTEPRPLDLQEISGDIPLYAFGVLIGAEHDYDNKGGAICMSLILNEFHGIKETLLDEGIHIDTEAFLDEYRKSPSLGFERTWFGRLPMHLYYWTTSEKPKVRMELTMLAALREDGTIPLFVHIRKDDPSYPPGYLFDKILYIKDDHSHQ